MLRANVLSSVLTELAKIQKDNNYDSDIGDNVISWNNLPLVESSLPAIVVMDPEVSFSDQVQGGAWKQNITIQVEIVAQEAAGITAVRGYMSDVYKCLEAGAAKIMGDNYLDQFYPEQDSIVVNDESSKLAGARIVLKAEAWTKKWGL